MKILMIGGTGNISTAVSERLLNQGHDLHLYCRDDGFQNNPNLKGAKFHYGDIFNEAETAGFLNKKEFDVVVDWIVWEPEHLQRDLRLFKGKTAQYIFISTASAYQKPPQNYIVTEEVPLINPHWEYSRNKTDCENILMAAYEQYGFPATVVRPSLTYGNTWIPYVIGNSWSVIDRMRKGKRVIVPGDGTSLWTVTHNTDFAKGFVGLMGKKEAIGEAFHITSDEVLTWDIILKQIAEAAGLQAHAAHISSEFIMAFLPDQEGNLLGDKVRSIVFDNSKLKRLVPDFKAETTFIQGIAKTIAYIESHPELQAIDASFEEMMDKIIAAHDYGMGLARPRT